MSETCFADANEPKRLTRWDRGEVPPEPQWATAAAVGPGAVRGAWGRGPPELQWATAAAAAVGPGGGGDKLGWGHIKILDKAPTEAYKTKPQHTRQK